MAGLKGSNPVRSTEAVAISAVIFDLGGVVLDWVPERAFEQVLPASDVPVVMERIGFREWNTANDAANSLAEAEAELTARFPEDAEAIRGYRRHFLHSVVGTVAGTPGVIAELQRAGVTVAALTNWSGELYDLTRPRFDILDRFADVVVSGKEGVAKPDPRIFAIACERNGLDPVGTVFVDDSPVNVAAANAFGLTGVLFTGAEQLRDDLADLGLPVRRPDAGAQAPAPE